MKYCSNCGQPLREGVKVCTNCGTPVRNDGPNYKHSEQRFSHQQPRSNKSNKKTWLIVAIVLAIIIALVVIFTIAKNQMSPEKQATHIAHAIKKDDAKSLSKQLTSNDHRLSEEEARAYLKYIKAENDLKHVADKVEENTKDIKNNHYNNLSVDANGNNILNISKDGKKYVFFDNYQFNVPQKSITLVSSDSGEITYEFNGDKHHISVEKDDDKELGTFPIGDYNLKASKDMEGKNFKGAITIDMSESDSIAYESFKQKRFNVDTEGGYILDNVKIYANGKEIGDGFSSETYGPYDPDEEVIVHAEGSYEGKTFKSNSVNVASASEKDGGVTDVTVKFDEEAIDQYVDKKSDEKYDDDSDDESDNDSSSGEVTRENVIDKVESYEGHTLDTDTYTYKEPEKTGDGKWGFSFLDKDEDLAGSYTVDIDDGYVTEYDEDGEEVGSGY